MNRVAFPLNKFKLALLLLAAAAFVAGGYSMLHPSAETAWQSFIKSQAIIGIGINIPTAIRLGRPATKPEDAGLPDLSSVLARRLANGTRAVAVILLVAVSAMAVARYVP